LVFIYNIFVHAYLLAVRVAANWNPKARAWVQGRKDLFAELRTKITVNDRVIWLHCSSAGEFEQGKPVIEALKITYPDHKILVSFFSPSGYSVAKNYPFADYITYLPLDTKSNAKTFLYIIRPELILFVKYEFWYHHLSTAAYRHIPVLLISATFRENQVFFKKHGGFFRQILILFRHIFVQDQNSIKLLQSASVNHVSIGGDTRFDRVAKIAEDFAPIPAIESFLTTNHSIVAGSTWKGDEELLKEIEGQPGGAEKLIIAPHEINQGHLNELHNSFPSAVHYSKLDQHTDDSSKATTLIIDNVGMLSRLYRYATITYVGGGFTKDGIHNILEAAVWGKPVIFGPNYKKYREATELIEAGGAFAVSNGSELKQLTGRLFNDEQYREAVGNKAKNYVLTNTGATERILQFIQANRLLTS